MITIYTLPTELIATVHSFLINPEDIANAARVCKLWLCLVDQFCWKQLVNTLPEDEVEYTLLPDHKAVCKDWFTINKKIKEMMANEKVKLESPFNTEDGMLTIIRHMCGKKRYDRALVIKNKNTPESFTEKDFQGHSLVKGIDSEKRNFIVIQFNSSIDGLSRIYLCDKILKFPSWGLYGNVRGIPTEGLLILNANQTSTTKPYHFIKELLCNGKATHVYEYSREVHKLTIAESPQLAPEYMNPEDS
ncbi:MAG: hypothetical protein K940chlam3_01445 [Chlamydiae bacterium]|nr:hypothetical protein [Chlamydiota bacterium]